MIAIFIILAGVAAVGVLFDLQTAGACLFLGDVMLFVLWVLLGAPPLKAEWLRLGGGSMPGGDMG